MSGQTLKPLIQTLLFAVDIPLFLLGSYMKIRIKDVLEYVVRQYAYFKSFTA
jgi:hypothetical protein